MIGEAVQEHFESREYMRERFGQMIADAQRILAAAVEVHAGGHDVVGRVVLFSGGNDSTVLAHLLRSWATHAAHANTSVGIEATRQFVRDTCDGWGLALLERTPPVSYADLVIERGFPGPAQHYKMFHRLKERALHGIRNELVQDPRRQRVLFVAGRRRAESARRAGIPEHERTGSIIWASPLANWSTDDMRVYRAMHPDTPRNPISDALGMSGECLCGAFAEPNEIDRVRAVDPDCAEWLERLQVRVAAAGHAEPRCTWGWGGRVADPDLTPGQAPKSGRLCSCHDQLLTLDGMEK